VVVVDLGEEMSHPMKLPLLDYFVDPCTIHRSEEGPIDACKVPLRPRGSR